ncbi:hypothetical protein AXF42_Ash009937 [Apostasia shenzhenica]|uniref:Uncharacterized protein n=1 Tax=Apostasia shenzhenica TaxID=1088818 RepID=A0A2I0ACC5_9ASPA|nr:hypothetical protein AXF42_Ash009937 [Apostasia shenzhenica]
MENYITEEYIIARRRERSEAMRRQAEMLQARSAGAGRDGGGEAAEALERKRWRSRDLPQGKEKKYCGHGGKSCGEEGVFDCFAP